MSSLCMRCSYGLVVSILRKGVDSEAKPCLTLPPSPRPQARWPLSQHHITGEFHVPMMLRQFFVTLEHKAPLHPGPVGLAHGLREGAGLIAAGACEVV